MQSKRPYKLQSAFVAFVIFMITALCTASSLASDRGPFTKTPQLRGELRDAAFFARDLNEDGMIDKEEVQRMIYTTFTLIDRNHDSSISETERMKYKKSYFKDYQIIFGSESNTFTERRMKALNSMDDDNNSRITKKEFYTYYTRRYERMDNNLDGVVSRSEFRLDIEKASTYEIDTTPK